MTKVGKARDRQQPDITRANHGNTHRLPHLMIVPRRLRSALRLSLVMLLAVQDRLSVDVVGKKEEVIDVGLPVAPTTIWQKHGCILQLIGAEPLDGTGAPFLQKV